MKTLWKDQAEDEVHDYCASYKCRDIATGWGKVIEVCLCAKNAEIAKLEQKLNKNVSRCCNGTMAKKHDDKLFCLNDQTQTRHAQKCNSGEMKSVDFEKVSFTSDGISFQNTFRQINLIKGDHQYCLGFEYSNLDKLDMDTFTESKIFYCMPETCPEKPCIRYFFYLIEVGLFRNSHFMYRTFELIGGSI